MKLVTSPIRSNFVLVSSKVALRNQPKNEIIMRIAMKIKMEVIPRVSSSTEDSKKSSYKAYTFSPKLSHCTAPTESLKNPKPPHSKVKKATKHSLLDVSAEAQKSQASPKTLNYNDTIEACVVGTLRVKFIPHVNCEKKSYKGKQRYYLHEVNSNNSISDHLVDTRRQIETRLIRSGNVASNPGPMDARPDGPRQGQQDQRATTRTKKPPAAMVVTSYNVRGLNDETKLRHLVNCLYKKCGGKNTDFIACLQETYLEKEGKIPYLWRGNYYQTPGAGNSCGCVTLLSPHLSIIEGKNIGNRAHVLACQKVGDSGVKYLIANIYAPNPNSIEKMNFFEEVFETIHDFRERFGGTRCLIVGDFNLNLKESEMKNRLYSVQEKRIAKQVKELAKEISVKDVWEDTHSFTWRRPNSDIFSTIDRILFSKDTLKMIECNSNWSLGFSDHAAVEASFSYPDESLPMKSRIVRLDPSLAKEPKSSKAIIEGITEMMAGAPEDWDPHLRLEFLKVCIRTVVEKVQAENKKLEQSEEDSLNEELDVAVSELAKGEATRGNQALNNYIEELRSKKSVLIEKKGKRLAEKLGTKWYNEGEKSTRYFMRLLNRANPDKFVSLEASDGSTITDEGKIEEEITNFYRNLYEDFNMDLIERNDDDFFQEIEPISGREDQELGRDITVEELRGTLATCTDSAPGPDGIPYSIIGLVWNLYGPILASAWQFSLENKKLPPSHKISYLKLIPKAGKDLNKLTNWRPITLSNCDHKLITKTYANRMCEKLASKIGEGQTAYLKGRLINDNLRGMLNTVEIANVENNLNGLIVALDAKKAFDSVTHEYIEECLKKFGCESFVKIFRVLYQDLSTDILINGKIVKGFKIKRGVKQGDSLSCILFIMCMEPLLRNIDRNEEISPLKSTLLDTNLPKSYAYADDVSCTISDEIGSLNALLKEYGRLTRMSGLELNADKTEIMRIGKDPNERRYNVTYLGRSYELVSEESIKLNGLFFHRDANEMRRMNVKSAMDKMDTHFKKWSRRSLTTLGKILIVKCFGISQIIYLMQTIALTPNDYKMINAMLYKFIWNRHYLAAKAPERIKREIVNKQVKYGGFGMLDISELDSSLKIKAIGRLIETRHPFLSLIKSRVDWSSYFEPKCGFKIDSMVTRGLELITSERNSLWTRPDLDSDRNLLSSIRDVKISDILNRLGKMSVTFFLISRRARRVGDLTLAQLAQLERYIPNVKITKLRTAVSLINIGAVDDDFSKKYQIGSKYKLLTKCTSKDIRLQRSNKVPITTYKIGMNLTDKEALSWGFKISKLTSVKHKATLLKVVHGDIYTKDKLQRFGLINDNTCPRCNEVEDLDHKILSCEYIKRIWQSTADQLKEPPAQDNIKSTFGALLSQSLTHLTIKCEILNRVLSLKDEQSYLVHPRTLVRLAIESVHKKEVKKEIKEDLRDLLAGD